jgi:hypothetical protein
LRKAGVQAVSSQVTGFSSMTQRALTTNSGHRARVVNPAGRQLSSVICARSWMHL